MKFKLIIILLLIFSCTSRNEEITFIVNSLRVPCEDVGPRSCLQVKLLDNDSDWKLFYDNIDGFNYEQGYIYKLKVIKIPTNTDIQAQDTSPFSYKLKAIIEKSKDSSILLNDIWLLKSIWNDNTKTDIQQNTFEKGNPILEIKINDKSFLGHEGCNDIKGELLTIEEGKITFGPVTSTEMMCPNPELSKAYIENLGQVNRYTYEQLQLIFYKDDVPLLKFKKID